MWGGGGGGVCVGCERERKRERERESERERETVRGEREREREQLTKLGYTGSTDTYDNKSCNMYRKCENFNSNIYKSPYIIIIRINHNKSQEIK